MDLNGIILELSIALKKSLPIDDLINKYGIEMVSDAMTFIEYDNREQVEVEEDYELKKI